MRGKKRSGEKEVAEGAQSMDQRTGSIELWFCVTSDHLSSLPLQLSVFSFVVRLCLHGKTKGGRRQVIKFILEKTISQKAARQH